VQELVERDRIIEDKRTLVEQQNTLKGIQMLCDTKTREIEAMRESLSDRDAFIADLEGQLANSEECSNRLLVEFMEAIDILRGLKQEVRLLMVFCNIFRI
jgi:hypothetical protein